MSTPGAVARDGPVPPHLPLLPPPAVRGLLLNPRFTFETFVVGPSNQLAPAVARAPDETHVDD